MHIQIRNTSLWDQNNKLFHGFLYSFIHRSPRSLPLCRTGRPRHLSPVSWSAWFMVFLIVNFTLSSYKWKKRGNEIKPGTLSGAEKMACSRVPAHFVYYQKYLCMSFSFVLATFVIYSPLIPISMNLVCFWCSYSVSSRSYRAKKDANIILHARVANGRAPNALCRLSGPLNCSQLSHMHFETET